MSLVEDALRKQEQDAARNPPPAAPLAAPEPAAVSWSTPAPRIDRRNPRRPKPPSSALLFLVTLPILLLVAVFVVLPLVSRNKSPLPAAPAKPAPLAPTNAGPPPPVIIPPVVTSAPLPVVLSSTPVMASIVTNPPAAISNAAAMATNSAPIEPPPLPAVVWPEIAIKGIFTTGGRTLVTLGNGITLEAGLTAPGGLLLLEASPTMMRFAFQGETRIYRRAGRTFLAVTNEVAVP